MTQTGEVPPLPGGRFRPAPVGYRQTTSTWVWAPSLDPAFHAICLQIFHILVDATTGRFFLVGPSDEIFGTHRFLAPTGGKGAFSTRSSSRFRSAAPQPGVDSTWEPATDAASVTFRRTGVPEALSRGASQ